MHPHSGASYTATIRFMVEYCTLHLCSSQMLTQSTGVYTCVNMLTVCFITQQSCAKNCVWRTFCVTKTCWHSYVVFSFVYHTLFCVNQVCNTVKLCFHLCQALRFCVYCLCNTVLLCFHLCHTPLDCVFCCVAQSYCACLCCRCVTYFLFVFIVCVTQFCCAMVTRPVCVLSFV